MAKKKAPDKREEFSIVTGIVVFFILLFALAFGSRVCGDDYAVVLKWWGAILLSGLAFYPLAYNIMPFFHDGGYVAAKPMGIVLGAWLIWALSTFKICRFNHLNVWILLVLCTILNYGIYYLVCRKKNKRMFEGFNVSKVSYIVYYEALFLAVFTLWCCLRSYRASITPETEKYMDFGFLKSLINAEYMPANDMWYSGESINYYYFGIYIGAYLAKFIGTTAGYAYNLDLMMIAGLGCIQVYSLVLELLNFAAEEHNERVKNKLVKSDPVGEFKQKMTGHLGGFLGAGAVFVAGNMQYVLYRFIIIPFQRGILRRSEEVVPNYWFPNATRFIQDGDDPDAYLIHEFPSYSFVLGDLHAHVTNITFVLLIMTILFAFMAGKREEIRKAKTQVANVRFGNIKDEIFYYIKGAANPAILIASFLIGVFKISNFWDFPIYFVVAGGMLMFTNAVVTGFNWTTLKLTAVHAVECLVISTIVALPFTIHFTSMTSGIGFCQYHSDPWELSVLWALPISVCVGLYVIAICAYAKRVEAYEKTITKSGGIIKDNPNDQKFVFTKFGKKKVNHVYSFINGLDLSDLFTLTLAICAVGLVLVCEIVYVKDIYGGGYERSNTMFKLTYQAYMMFGIVMAYGISRMISFLETKRQAILSAVALFFVIWSFGYLKFSVDCYITNIKTADYVTSLDSNAKLEEAETEGYENSDRAELLHANIDWISENINPNAVIAQMYTTAYRPFSSISTYTGNPNVVGWGNHEGLWRNDGDIDLWWQVASERKEDIKKLYTTESVEEARAIIDKYNIDYIYVGYNETMDGEPLQKEPEVFAEGNGLRYFRGAFYNEINLNYDLLRSLGTVVRDCGTAHYSGMAYRWNKDIRDYDWIEFDHPYECFIVKVSDRY